MELTGPDEDEFREFREEFQRVIGEMSPWASDLAWTIWRGQRQAMRGETHNLGQMTIGRAGADPRTWDEVREEMREITARQTAYVADDPQFEIVNEVQDWTPSMSPRARPHHHRRDILREEFIRDGIAALPRESPIDRFHIEDDLPVKHHYAADPDSAPARLCLDCGMWPEHHEHLPTSPDQSPCVCVECDPEGEYGTWSTFDESTWEGPGGDTGPILPGLGDDRMNTYKAWNAPDRDRPHP